MLRVHVRRRRAAAAAFAEALGDAEVADAPHASDERRTGEASQGRQATAGRCVQRGNERIDSLHILFQKFSYTLVLYCTRGR